MQLLGNGWGKIVLPPGEATKSAVQWSTLLEALATARLDRKSILIALGGGVVGDLTGFAAATFMRGIRFVQVPTTLLAMVDSSVGGKTGINLQAGKNLAGAFHQPMAVYADTLTLATLPEREFAAGMAEVVKYGVALDADFFAWLEQHVDEIRARAAQAMDHVVAHSCQIKADVVSRDERESGLRAVLNFGHTLGHAIEQATGYSRILHGEAVALGMAFALAVSVRTKGFPAEDARRAGVLLRRFGLDVAQLRPQGLDWRTLHGSMQTDKKAAEGAVRFVLCDRLGRGGLPEAVPAKTLEAMLKGWCNDGLGE
jgi:3-dehydroquinate synthase